MDSSKLNFPAMVTFSAKKALPKATVCFEVQGYTMVHSAFGYGNETVLCFVIQDYTIVHSALAYGSETVLCFVMQGYTMVHSAFGYGNETVLCNDPHALPYTSLDDAEAVELAVKKSNISVKICRIGPWVFPVEVTTCFLPKGVDLLC